MKTLKKTLCLVLAMVMVFGLCAVSASAKLEYTDNDDITYDEAVDVMSGIGILAGDSRGFRPTADITRAEAAKIMAYIIIGNAKQADAVKASRDPFPDVPASHWAAGYIDYCVTAGVIMGKADGYHPNENVTGLEFAAMLLRALGYGKQGEFVGSDWAINTSKYALRLGIFDGNLAGASATEDATREECALYAFNMITGPKKVSYSELLGNYIVTGTGLGEAADANKGETFAKDFKLGNTKDDGDEYDDFGRVDGYYWYVNKKSNRVTDYYVNGEKLKEKYTAKVTGADIRNLLGASAIKDAVIDVYKNGDSAGPVAEGSEITWAEANFEKGKTETLAGTGNGVETYVYAWTDSKDVNHIRVCIIDTYMVKVEKVTKATSTKDAETKVDILDQSAKWGTTAKTFETEEFEKGDYVLVTIANDKIQTMEPVEIVEDTVTRFTQDGSKKSIVSGGETYVAAKNVTADAPDLTSAATIAKSIVDGDNHKLYIDKNNYLIAVADVKTESDYVYVSHFGDKTDTSGDFNTPGVAAKVYYADGTNGIVKIGEINGSEPDDATDGSCVPGIYKLTKDGSKVNLEALDTNDGGTTGEAVKATVDGQVRKGIASSIKEDGSVTATNKTVFFYVKNAKGDDPTETDNNWNKKDFTVTVYTGINSVPTNKGSDKALAKAALVKDDETTAAAVLVVDTDDGDATDTVYIYNGDYNVVKSGDKYVATYKTYVNGEEYDLEISYNEKGDVKIYDAKKFFTLDTSNEADYTTKLDGNTDIDKYKYEAEINVADPGTDIGEYDYKLTVNGAPTKFAGLTTKVIDLSGNKIGEDYDDLYAFVSDVENDVATLTVAIQFGEVNYLYITDVTTSN